VASSPIARIRSLTIVKEFDVSIQPQTANPPATGPPMDGLMLDVSDLHVLRLCLDLQLDALLLTVGAASSQATGSGPPWHRWVNEDIQLACSLAAEAHTGSAGPPSGLASDLNRAVPHTTENGLHARYTSVVALLSGLISRPRIDDPGQGEPPQPRASGVTMALEHYQERVVELETHPWRQPANRVAGYPMPEVSYLPGELLG
jgi:hypothetical protein